MDFADILEELRRTLRRLCVGPVQLAIEESYGEDIADVGRLRALSSSLRDRAAGMEADARREIDECAPVLDRLAESIEAEPARPSREDLCRRYGEGLLDARTIIYLTGWNLEKLYDECERVTGRPAPDAYTVPYSAYPAVPSTSSV